MLSQGATRGPCRLALTATGLFRARLRNPIKIWAQYFRSEPYN